MYNAHRGMVPAANSRLNELLDQVRQEFDSQQNRTGEYESNSKFAKYVDGHVICTPAARSRFFVRHLMSSTHRLCKQPCLSLALQDSHRPSKAASLKLDR